MPIQVDIRKTFLYKWGKEEGLKEGKQKGLKEGEKRGIEKGLKEGLKRAIVVDIKLKFGSQKVRQIKKLLDKINDINRLEKIKKEVIISETWEDFSKVFRNHK